ncbi:hypothetical protein HDE68_002966 [Pedobacter cryoconitis]|uniref:Uncharacterized protein n=1 Tax=Pedobacter cryoconitis TaxID=188932 RepID=A0A7W8ZN33_9SPHI|nr:hypothetical protein [Pedobacter cryoconitis]MBB5637053.1 hypothetical protein [Pedobacter cryoconitis]
MKAKEVFKEYVSKNAALTEEQFDDFFSHFELQNFKFGTQKPDRGLPWRIPGNIKQTLSYLRCDVGHLIINLFRM